MARRKRADFTAPQVRRRVPRPVAAAHAPAPEPVSAFPPGTLRRVLVGGLLGALVLGAVAAYVLHGQRTARTLQTALTAGTCSTDRRADPLSGPHRSGPVFHVDPPAGGTHTEQVAKAGVYAAARVPVDGALVHALEHGYVVLWHRPGVGVAELSRIEADHPGDVVVAERASLPVPVAATAWERRLLCREVEPLALERFVRAYVGQGPERLPRG